MKIVLLEFIDEAKEFMGRYGKDFLVSEGTLVICLHPAVTAFLKDKGIESGSTLDYLDNAAQHRIILKTEGLTTKLLERVSLRDEFGIEKGYKEALMHHIRLYLNHFFWIIEILDAVRNKHEVTAVYCGMVKNESGMYSASAYIQDEERFLGLLARDFCKVNQLNFSPLKMGFKKPDFISKVSAGIIEFFTAIITLAGYSFISSNYKNEKRIVVPALSYRMDRLMKDIKQHNPGVRCFMVLEGKATLKQELFKLYLVISNFLKKLQKKNIVEHIIFIELLRKFFKSNKLAQKEFGLEFDKLTSNIQADSGSAFLYKGISTAPYLTGKVSKGLRGQMLKLQHSVSVLYRVLQRLRPKLLISMYSVEVYYMMGELSHILGFSSLDISHGTHVPPNNEYEEIENYRLATSVILNTYKHVAVQTPWADKFLDYYKDGRPRVFSGPLIYSTKDKDAAARIRIGVSGLKNNDKVLVHATTQKLRHGMRFHIEETLDEYISSLVDIVNTVNSFEKVWLIIRPHPVCDISKDEFLRLLPRSERLIIMNKGPFSEVLSVADILISYSSTCIEEALQNGIPVVLYDKWGRYNHFNAPEIKTVDEIARKPVYYISSPEALSGCIPKILGVFSNSVLNDSDLKEYRYPWDYRMNFYDFVNQALV